MPLSSHEIRELLLIGVVIASVAAAVATLGVGLEAFFIVPGVSAPFVLYELRRRRGSEVPVEEPQPKPIVRPR